MKAANNEIRMGGGVGDWRFGAVMIYIGHPNHLVVMYILHPHMDIYYHQV